MFEAPILGGHGSGIAVPTDLAPIATSRIMARGLAQDPRQQYYLYVPQGGGCDAPTLVTVHGISRNAREHIEGFQPLAEQYGVVVVAPVFPRDRFPDYQRLGQSGRGERPDRALGQILAELRAVTKADTNRLLLFGFSGGGQFVHRYAMAYPRNVAAVAVGAAGWYTFPDPLIRFPRGLEPHPGLGDLRFDAAEFLKIPMAVFVGERDIRRGTVLKQSNEVDEQQGATRLERGERWIAAMRAAAARHKLPTRYAFSVLPEAGHSFRRSMRSGQMGGRVFDFLLAHRAWSARNDDVVAGIE
jgi:poly(3-hydroxybutyrate) depolymerase